MKIIILAILLVLTGCGMFEKSESELIALAKDYKSKGDINAAVIELKNALRVNPENKVARELLGDLFLGVADGAAAEKEFNRAISLGVSSEKLKIKRLKSLLLQQKFQQVLDESESIKNLALNAEVSVLKGGALLGLGSVQKAEREFQASIAESPKLIEAHNGFVRTLLAAGKLDQAEEKLSENIKVSLADKQTWYMFGQIMLQKQKYETAVEAYSEAVKGSNKHTINTVFLAYVGMVRAKIALEKYDLAEKNIRFLMDAVPRHPQPKYLLGFLNYQKKDYVLARQYLEEVISQIPNYRPAMLLLGAIGFSENNLEQAELYLNNYLVANPEHGGARRLLGATRLKLNKPEGATETLEPLLAQNKDDAELLAMLGKASLMSGAAEKGVGLLEKAAKIAPDSNKFKLDVVQALMMEGRYDDALVKLKKIPKTDDSGQVTGLLTAINYVKKNNYEKAEVEIDKLLTNDPGNVRLALMKASVLEKSNKFKEAKASIGTVLARDDKNIAARFLLAGILEKESLLEQASELYKKILEQDRGNLAASLRMAELALKNRKPNDFVRYLEVAAENNSSALQPNVLLANYYINAPDLEKAKIYVVSAETIDKEHIQVLMVSSLYDLANNNAIGAQSKLFKLTQKQPNSWLAYYHLARAYSLAKKLDNAKSSLEKAISLNNRHLPSYVALVRVEMLKSDVNSALKVADKIIQMDAKDVNGHLIKGNIYAVDKKYDLALTEFKRGPKSSMVIDAMFRVNNSMNKPDKANQLAEKWLGKNPNDKHIRLLLASGYLAVEDNKSALKHFKVALDDHPDDPVILNNLAWLSYKEGKPEALEYGKKAHDLKPNEAVIIDTYGWILVNMGRESEGVKLLEKALLLLPNNAEIQYHLAAGLIKAGRVDEADRHLKDLANQKLSFVDAEDAKKLIEKYRR